MSVQQEANQRQSRCTFEWTVSEHSPAPAWIDQRLDSKGIGINPDRRFDVDTATIRAISGRSPYYAPHLNVTAVKVIAKNTVTRNRVKRRHVLPPTPKIQ
jgi:hypothetical protein